MVAWSLINTGIIENVTYILYGSVISDNTEIIVSVTSELYGSVISDKYRDNCECDFCTLW